MRLPFSNKGPGYDEERRNSVFFERGLHATSICGAVGSAVTVEDLTALLTSAGRRRGRDGYRARTA